MGYGRRRAAPKRFHFTADFILKRRRVDPAAASPKGLRVYPETKTVESQEDTGQALSPQDHSRPPQKVRLTWVVVPAMQTKTVANSVPESWQKLSYILKKS